MKGSPPKHDKPVVIEEQTEAAAVGWMVKVYWLFDTGPGWELVVGCLIRALAGKLVEDVRTDPLWFCRPALLLLLS